MTFESNYSIILSKDNNQEEDIMVTLYTSPSCTSCRKAKHWLVANKIEFVERNLSKDPLTRKEILNILRMTENGTEDIISTRSKAYLKLKLKPESMSLNQLVDLLIEKPDLLKRPILIDEKRMQVGFNEEEIRRFIPRDARVRDLISLLKRESSMAS